MTASSHRPKKVTDDTAGPQPGKQYTMRQQPQTEKPSHVGTGKLSRKVALVTGGDSGIGRAVAVAFAKEGADIAISYLSEDKDAADTKRMVEQHGARCMIIRGDIGDDQFCKNIIKQVVAAYGRLDILVNNAAEQHKQDDLLKISKKQLESTFRTNILSMFYLSQAALPHLREGKTSTIINTTSVVAYDGHPQLMDYAATKGAIVSFTRSLSGALAPKIRVNAVAPGPIWTPLIPATFPKEKVETFGRDVPLGRPGQPEEVASCFVFLASDDSSYMTGQVLHPNGGRIVNG